MSSEPVVVHVTKFSAVQHVGDAYRSGATVDLVLDAASIDTVRRVIDFVSGLVYVTEGTMDKLGDRQFRLIPGSPPPTD